MTMHVSTLHLQNTAGSFAFNLPSEYGWVLIVAAVIALELLLIGFIFPGKARQQFFTQQFMSQHFGTEHKQIFGKDIEKGGYPDMGSGRYASKLTYEQWYKFNNAQRAHNNFVEFAPTTFVLLFVAGLYFPVPAAAIGLGVIIFRFVYAAGYASGGPAGRVIGALANDLCLLGLFGLSIASGVMFIQDRFISKETNKQITDID